MALKLGTPPADVITVGTRGPGKFPNEAADLIELAVDGDERFAQLELRRSGDDEKDVKMGTTLIRQIRAGTRKADFYGPGAWEASYDKATHSVWVRCIDPGAAMDAAEAREAERAARTGGNGHAADADEDAAELVDA